MADKPVQGDLFNDPATYRKLSEPFASAEEANKAMRQFWEELGELRKKHRIRDLLAVAYIAVTHEGGEEADHMLPMHYGHHANAESMAAYAMGMEAMRRQKRISRLAFEKAIKSAPRAQKDEDE